MLTDQLLFRPNNTFHYWLFGNWKQSSSLTANIQRKKKRRTKGFKFIAAKIHSQAKADIFKVFVTCLRFQGLWSEVCVLRHPIIRLTIETKSWSLNSLTFIIESTNLCFCIVSKLSCNHNLENPSGYFAMHCPILLR